MKIIFIMAFIASFPSFAQRPVQFDFTAGLVGFRPKVDQSVPVQTYIGNRGYKSFEQFADSAQWQTSFAKPQFVLGLRVQPLRKVPIFGVAGLYTSAYSMPEISFKVGAGAYFRKWINPTVRRKHKYGFYADFGGQFTHLWDKGFQDVYSKSIRDITIMNDFGLFRGINKIYPAAKVNVLEAFIAFGHLSDRDTEVGFRAAFQYDPSASVERGSMNQFTSLLYFRF